MGKRTAESENRDFHGSKKAKVKGQAKAPKTDPLDVAKLEKLILDSPKNYNHIVDLLEALNSLDHDEAHFYEICASLTKIFGQFAKEKKFSRKSGSSDSALAVVLWLNERYDEFKESLNTAIEKSSPSFLTATATALKCVSIESKYFTSDTYYYPKQTMRSLVVSLLKQPGNKALQSCVESHKSYDDFRYYLYQEIANLLDEEEGDDDDDGDNLKKWTDSLPREKALQLSKNLVDILMDIHIYPKTEDDLQKWWLTEPEATKNSLKHSSPVKLSSHRLMLQKCWIAVLRLPHTNAQYQKILAKLHKQLIPNMAKPQFLMDFLTDAYNAGGVISFLALNSVFLLMQSYNLDYPDFFKKLYTLFQDGSIMHVKYRSRVFRLLDLFLSSTHLPATITASFIKRMARLSLTAPAGAIVSVIPFIYNQLKRHPTCMAMIHRRLDDSSNSADYVDPFDDNELDPILTHAIDSSLWELDSLQHHYHPNVSALARIMSQPFSKPQYVLEDFLDHSYKSLIKAEHARNMRQIPALEFETFDSIVSDYIGAGLEW